LFPERNIVLTDGSKRFVFNNVTRGCATLKKFAFYKDQCDVKENTRVKCSLAPEVFLECYLQTVEPVGTNLVENILSDAAKTKDIPIFSSCS